MWTSDSVLRFPGQAEPTNSAETEMLYYDDVVLKVMEHLLRKLP